MHLRYVIKNDQNAYLKFKVACNELHLGDNIQK